MVMFQPVTTSTTKNREKSFFPSQTFGLESLPTAMNRPTLTVSAVFPAKPGAITASPADPCGDLQLSQLRTSRTTGTTGKPFAVRAPFLNNFLNPACLIENQGAFLGRRIVKISEPSPGRESVPVFDPIENVRTCSRLGCASGTDLRLTDQDATGMVPSQAKFRSR